MNHSRRKTVPEHLLPNGREIEVSFQSHLDIAHHDADLRRVRSTEGFEVSARLEGVESKLQSLSPTARPDIVDAVSWARTVRQLISSRQRRYRFFPSDMFADPAWDILLELYLAELEQRRVAVSTLCVAAEVPATTALRWTNTLVDRGMLCRRPDILDRRRIYIELTQF
ncbi:MAG: hypothetical protein M3Q16_01135, partial [Pseudomonadota bacterium]|nr:hypothetical protein [Pseudomonadota bacterium]